MKGEKFKKLISSRELVEKESICKIQTIENKLKKIVEARFIEKREHCGGLDKHLYIFKQSDTYRTFVCFLREIKEIKTQ